MRIGWADLGQVLVIGLVLGAGVVAVYAVGVRALAGGPSPGVPRLVTAGLCFVLCAAAVGYGIYTLL